MRCAVYVRVSTDMETQKSSIAHQISFFEKYIEEKDYVLYKIYQDIESGTNIKNREGLKRLLEDSKQHQFDMILTKSVSRFARNTLEGLTLIREFRDQNIRFVTIEDGFDSDEYDEFMFTLLLSIAQKESEKMSQRIKFGKISRAKKGGYNGSSPPYGYIMEDGRIVPAEDGSTYIVQKIFSMYLDGNGFYKIAKELNKNHYPTPSQVANKKNSSPLWHQSTVGKILSNPFYVGDMVQHKTQTKNVMTGERRENPENEYIQVLNTHGAIIGRGTFEEVKRRLQKKKGPGYGNQSSLFSNLLICGECGNGMHYKKQRKTYMCGKLNKMGKDYCKGVYIKEGEIKGILQQQLKEIIHERIDKNSLLEALKKEEIVQHEKNKIKKIQRSITQMNNKNDRLLEFALAGMVEKDTFVEKLKAIGAQKKLLEEKKEQIKQDMESGENHLMTMVDRVLSVEALDTLMIQKFITKIGIYRDHRVEIEYDFSI